MEGELAVSVLAVGNGRVDGKTRALVTQQRETLRGKVLLKALSEYHDKTARPVWAFPQFDKMLCLAACYTCMSGPVLQVAMATQ